MSAVAEDQLRSFVERIERLEEERKTIADDIADVYREAHGNGFDKKALKRVVSERRKDESDRAEADAVFDLYWTALHGASHVHVHEGRGE